MNLASHLKEAAPAAGFHFLVSCAVAAMAALLVWFIWFPYPYVELSGGRELFLLLVCVDIVCGPLLTLVVFKQSKSRAELGRDLAVIGMVQMAALLYGLHTVYSVRPLYLVHEIDRYRVVTWADFQGVDVRRDIEALAPSLRPALFSGPRLVGTRKARDMVEYTEVLAESMKGGRDFAQRPDFYVAYDDSYALSAMQRARPVGIFLERFPERSDEISSVLLGAGASIDETLFLPVVHREDWIALIDKAGRILGFARGDGFAVL